MTDSEKLDALADWLDVKFPDDPDPEVQIDLRRIASKLNKLENILHAYDTLKDFFKRGLL